MKSLKKHKPFSASLSYHKFCEVVCLDTRWGFAMDMVENIYYKTDKDNFYLFYKKFFQYKLICKIPRNNDILFSIGNTGDTGDTKTIRKFLEYNISFNIDLKTLTFYNIYERPLNLFLNMVVNVYELYKPRLHHLYRENYNKEVAAMSHMKQILDNKQHKKLEASLSLLRYKGQNKDTINHIKNYLTNI